MVSKEEERTRMVGDKWGVMRNAYKSSVSTSQDWYADKKFRVKSIPIAYSSL